MKVQNSSLVWIITLHSLCVCVEISYPRRGKKKKNVTSRCIQEQLQFGDLHLIKFEVWPDKKYLFTYRLLLPFTQNVKNLLIKTQSLTNDIRYRVYTVVLVASLGLHTLVWCLREHSLRFSSPSGRLAFQQPIQRNPPEDDKKAAATSVHRSDGETLHG